MNKSSEFLAISLILSMNAVDAANVIKCRDSEGAISYADTTCPPGQTQLNQIRYKEYKAPKNASHKSLEKSASFPEPEKALAKKPIQRFQSKLSKALVSAEPVKERMQEFYLEQGKWPQGLKDLGFEPREMTTQLIKKTLVTTKGQISIKLNNSFGSNKEIWFYPKLEMGGTQVNWVCYTNFPSSMLDDKNPDSTLCESRYF